MARAPIKTQPFAEYGRHQGVSYQTVRNWAEAKKIKLAGRGRVDVAASDEMIAASRGSTKDAPKLGPTDASAAYSTVEAMRIKENFVAAQKRLAFEQEAGTLARVDVLAEVMASQGAALRSKLLALGSALGPRVAMLRSPEQCTAIIDTEVVRILDEIIADAKRAREAIEIAL